MIEGDKSHTSGWGWVWRIDLDRKVQVFFFVMVRNTLKWACLNMFYSNYFLTMFSSGLSPSVKWECWKLPTRAPKSPLPSRLGDSQKWWSNSPGIGPTPPTHPLPPTPNQPPPANFRAMIKGHFGTLVSAPWTSSFGSRLWQRGSGRRKTVFTKLLFAVQTSNDIIAGNGSGQPTPNPKSTPCQFWRSDKSSFWQSRVASLDPLVRLQALTGSGRTKNLLYEQQKRMFYEAALKKLTTRKSHFISIQG